MGTINCENRNKRKKVNCNLARRAAGATLDFLNIKKSDINIVFFSSQAIRGINKKYLGRNEATDVIAFWQENAGCTVKKGRLFLGDIAISTDKALVNSRRYATSYDHEVMLYVIHGILHLAGFRDDTVKNRKLMREYENKIIGKIRKSRR